MNQKLLVFLIAIFSIQSHALISDRFRCRMEIQDVETKSLTFQEQDFYIARLPSPKDPSEDFSRTAGETEMKLRLETAHGTLTGNFNFNYQHAVREDHGVATDARQWVCMALAGAYCKKPSSRAGGVVSSCMDSKIACLQSPGSPFDTNNGWMLSGVFHGVPTFNERSLSPTIAEMKDELGDVKGTARVNCQFLGSYL